MLRLLPLVGLILSACSPAAPEYGEGPAARTEAPVAQRLTVADLRVRAMPEGAPATAAFMTLTVEGPGAALVDARSEAAKAVELHTHTEVDGMMQMRPIARIPLPSGEAVALAPGGLHVMLIGPVAPMAEGTSVDLTLVFDDGSEQPVSAPVRAMTGPHSKGPKGAHQGSCGDCGEAAGECACGKADGHGEAMGAGKHDGHGAHHGPGKQGHDHP